MPLLHRPMAWKISSRGPARLLRRPQASATPACFRSAAAVEAPLPRTYWKGRAWMEGFSAVLLTTLITSTVHAAPELFSQSPLQSLETIKGLVLPGLAPSRSSVLLDCP
jgi:hypothetical protein